MVKASMAALAAVLLATLLLSSSAEAYYGYGYDDPYAPTYYYYGDGYDQDYYDRMPIVAGPYPRYYVGFGGSEYEFYHDDLNYFDTYEGYRDLDVFNPDGSIDVLRNPAGSLEPISDVDYVQVYNSSSAYHVYGMLPGGSVYRKHYYHDHDWDIGYAGYYNFVPYDYYSVRPVYGRNCLQTC